MEDPLFHTCCLIFQAKNDVRSAPASNAVPKFRTEAITCIPQIVTFKGTCRGERNGAQRRTKMSFGRTMMQALQQLQLVKRHVTG